MRKVDEILLQLREELRCGHYREGSRFPSEQKLMKRFNTTRITINKVTEQLSAEGFLKRGPQGSGTRVETSSPFPSAHLAYLGPIVHPYYARMLSSIQKNAFLKNCAVSVFCPDPDLFDYCLKKIMNGKFAGLLVSGVGCLPEGEYPIPVVYLDNSLPAEREASESSVTCDNYQGAFAMAEAVLVRGHRGILIATNYKPTEYSRAERIRGFRDALLKYGITSPDARMIHNFQLHVKSLEQKIKLFPDTTAVLCDSDDLAGELREEWENAFPGKKILFTGFGNLRRIPTVDQHQEEIGAIAVDMLMDKLGTSSSMPHGTVRIKTDLVNTELIPIL